jgi:hypothetical protein
MTYGGNPIRGGSTGGAVPPMDLGPESPKTPEVADVPHASTDDEVYHRFEADPIHQEAQTRFENGEIDEETYASAVRAALDRAQFSSDNVTDIRGARHARDVSRAGSVLDDHQKVNDLLDQHLDYAHDIQDNINSGDVPLTLNELKEEAQRAAEMRDAMPKNHPLRYKGDELASMYADMVKGYHSDPVADKVPMDSSHEKMTGPVRENAPANDAEAFTPPLSKEDSARAKELLAGDRAKAKELLAGDRERLKEIDKREGRYGPIRKFTDDFKEMLKDDEAALKGSGDAEGPDGEKSRPELRKQKKLLLDKLGDALEQGQPIRREAEEAIRLERARRIAAAMKARSQKGGEAGFYSELASAEG